MSWISWSESFVFQWMIYISGGRYLIILSLSRTEAAPVQCIDNSYAWEHLSVHPWQPTQSVRHAYHQVLTQRVPVSVAFKQDSTHINCYLLFFFSNLPGISEDIWSLCSMTAALLVTHHRSDWGIYCQCHCSLKDSFMLILKFDHVSLEDNQGRHYDRIMSMSAPL